MEARIYNPNEKKLGFQTISGYFICYLEKYKGYRFSSYPTHSTEIVKTDNVRFMENGEINRSDQSLNKTVQEVRMQVKLGCKSHHR